MSCNNQNSFPIARIEENWLTGNKLFELLIILYVTFQWFHLQQITRSFWHSAFHDSLIVCLYWMRARCKINLQIYKPNVYQIGPGWWARFCPLCRGSKWEVSKVCKSITKIIKKKYINNQKLKGLIENKQAKYEKRKLLSFYSIHVSVFKLWILWIVWSI